MTPRTFLVLSGATFVAVVLAVGTSIHSTSNDAISERGQVLLPGLAGQASEIRTVRVETGKDEITISKDTSHFVDESGFPVKSKALRDLITSLAVLKIEEKKTADPARYDDLDLAEPHAETGNGRKITFLGEGDKKIASLIVGTQNYSVGGASGAQYVRRVDEEQSYLVRGSVKLPYGRIDWFDKKLFETEADKIDQLTLRDGDEIMAQLVSSGGKLQLAAAPNESEPDQSKISRISRLIERLEFSDVRAAGKKRGGNQKKLIVKLADGMGLAFASIAKDADGSRWVKISANARSDKAKSTVDDLRKKLEGFEFKLSRYDSEIFDWKVEDLTKGSQS